VGEYVFMAQGREATFPLPDKFNPADLTIVAIIDDMRP
jgi:microcompartment protein CcmK/EutM